MKPFSLLIKPASADCNLRCQYCFYLEHAQMYPESKVHRMSEQTLQSMISKFMSIKMPQYSFGWQGGEPTMMGVDFFRKVISLQKEYGRPGTVVANGLQTNGTLIDAEFAEFLAENKFLLGVSLDGPPEIHDHYRLNSDHQPTHDKVMEGISHLRSAGAEFNILTLVNDRNSQDGKLLYRYLCDNGFNFQQYIPCVEFDRSGKPLPFTVNPQRWGEFLCEIYDQWRAKDTRKISIRLFDSIVNYYYNGTRNCCNMGDNCCQYFVVEHNGDIFPCDFFVEPELKLGNINTDQWQQMADSQLYKDFGAQKSCWNDACSACEFLEVCAGGCLKNRFQNGNDPKQISWLCPGWKIFYQHALPGLKELANSLKKEHQAAQMRATQAPQQSSGKNIKANDPCPCGSGLKYKKCCARK